MLAMRGVWLPQVPLRRLGVDWRHVSPPPDAKSPGPGCLYLGGRTIMANSTINGWIQEALAAGYSIQELDPPPCVPSEFAPCLISSNTPSKYVWACPPSVTQETPVTGAPAAASAPTSGPSPLVILGGVTGAAVLVALVLG